MKLQVNSEKHILAGIRTQDLHASQESAIEVKRLGGPNYLDFFCILNIAKKAQTINYLLAIPPVSLRWATLNIRLSNAIVAITAK
jgi:hypothetical protein